MMKKIQMCEICGERAGYTNSLYSFDNPLSQ